MHRVLRFGDFGKAGETEECAAFFATDAVFGKEKGGERGET